MDARPGDECDPTTLAQQVRAIWREVLGAADGQDGATFFDLQGQSISAVRIVARIEDELGVEVDVGALFEDPDLPAFVGVVVAAAQAQRAADR
jgi:acyl carrier protein